MRGTDSSYSFVVSFKVFINSSVDGGTAVEGESEVSVEAEGGLVEDIAGAPEKDLDDEAGGGAEGVFKGGFNAATGGKAGRFTGKFFSSSKSPFWVNIKTDASRYTSGDLGRFVLNRIVLKLLIPNKWPRCLPVGFPFESKILGIVSH